MSTPVEIPFQQVLDALLDVDNPFPARLLYRLSDLEGSELQKFQETWPNLPAWRRKALMEDVQMLGEKDTLLSFESLARFVLADSDPAVRLPATRALWEYEHPSLIKVFLGLLDSDPDPEVRAAAASGLGRFVYEGEIEELPAETLRQIEDRLLAIIQGGEEPVDVRRRALESLGYSGRGEVEGLVENAYQSDNKDWVASALFAMGRSANKRWSASVFAMLESPFPALRGEAARAAGELEMRKAVPRLLELLDDPDRFTRETSIWSLSQIGGSGVRPVLERLYEEAEDPDELDYLEAALDNLSFTEDMQLMPIFDIAPDDDEHDEDADFDDGVDASVDALDAELDDGLTEFEDLDSDDLDELLIDDED